MMWLWGLPGALVSMRVYNYFGKGCRKKMCTRQSRKVIWDMIDTLFLPTVAVEPPLFLSVSTRKHIFMAFRANSFKFLWRTVNSKPPTMPFRIVACTFSDNLSWNSCMSSLEDKLQLGPSCLECLLPQICWWYPHCNARYTVTTAMDLEYFNSFEVSN